MFATAQPGTLIETDTQYVIPQFRQLQILVDRCFRIYWRSDSYNLVRSLLVVVMALLFGTVYWRMQACRLLPLCFAFLWPAKVGTLTMYWRNSFLGCLDLGYNL